MRMTFLALALSLIPFSRCFAAEPESKKDADVEQLLERIEELEKRLERLEAQQRKQPRFVIPNKPEANPPKFVPRKNEPAPRVVPSPGPKPFMVPPQSRVPNVPDSWKPFYFNGQWCYVIPLGEES